MKTSECIRSIIFAGCTAALLLAVGCAGPEHRRTTGEYFNDQSINARVKTALLQDDEVSGLDVSTTTFDGVVQLSGFVDSADQRMRAEEIARDVAGVEDVVNNITINPRESVYGAPDERPESADPAEMDEPSPLPEEKAIPSEPRQEQP